MESIYNVLVSNIYNKGLTESLMKEDATLKKKREDLTRVLALLDKALRSPTAVSNAGRMDPGASSSNSKHAPWEKSGAKDIDWSVVKGTKSLLSH